MRQFKSRRTIVAAVVVLLGVGGVAAYVVALPLVRVGMAYKAKMLCSEVFVAGRRTADVLADMVRDDLGALRLIPATVDSTAATATARFFPLAARRARYDRASGCTLDSEPGRASAGPIIAEARDTTTPIGRSRPAIEAVLDEAFSEPDPSHPRRTRAVVVMQHGRIVAERYVDGIGPNTPLLGWSMAKSVLNALVGIAVGQNRLAVNAPAPLRAWAAAGDPRRRITVGDLLHMTSGLHFDEAPGSPSSDLLEMLFDQPDMAAFAANMPLDTTPGSRWEYSTGTSVLLSRALREALGDDAYRRLPREALFGPLGMTHAVLESDGSGTFVASSYMYATAREWARFGQLYLQDGVWNGRRILPEGWVAYTRTPAPAAPGGVYGAHFWLATPAEYRGPPAALPAGIFHAVGHEGQFISIVPSAGVVIVRLGKTRYASAWLHDRFLAAMLAALE